MEALFLQDVKAISSAGRRRTNNKSSHNSRSRSSTSQNITTVRTSPTRNKGNQPASESIISNKVRNKSASSNNCSGSSSKSGKRIQTSPTNDTSTLKRKRMSPKLKKLDSLATSSPSSQRIFEGDISPMDYRPQQKRRRNKKKNHMPNVAVDNDTIDTSNGMMLKEYVDQWTKLSSPTKSTRKREIKNNVATTNNNDKQDSSSASIISTSSSHSAVDNNDYEGIVRSEGRVVDNKDIELEYGQLAFMKKDLERKMRLYQQGSTGITSTTPHNNKTVEENNKLELEYGKLSFMKQELEHKMSIYKMDAEKINPLSSTTRKEAPTRVFHAPSSSHNNVMMDGESRMLVSASKKAINIERPDNHDLAAPSRQDVEFGARAFQRIMSERRRLPRVEDVGEHYQAPHKRRRRGYQYNGDEHDDDDNDDDDDDYSVKHLGDSKSRSIHRGDKKKKRKRKRRVVETRITRVFHEESEEAESGSTSTTSPSCRTSSRLDYDRRQQGRQSLILPCSQGLNYTSMSKEETRNRMKNKNKSSPSVLGSGGRRHKQMRAKSQSSMLEGLS